jgi:hypothetical protein
MNFAMYKIDMALKLAILNVSAGIIVKGFNLRMYVLCRFSWYVLRRCMSLVCDECE